MNGNSQAVRIPHEFRLSVNRVQVSRNAAGDLVISAMPADRGAAFLQALQGFDDALSDELFVSVTEQKLSQLPVQEREPL